VDLLADEDRRQGRAHQQDQQRVLELTREHGEWSRAMAAHGVRTDLRLTFVGLVGRQGLTASLAGG
jgi:hypothetical protein